MSRRSTRKHVEGSLVCGEHQILFEDEPTCWCGVLHAPEVRECEQPCPLWNPVFYHGTRAPFRPGGYVMPRCQHGAEGSTAPISTGHQQPTDATDWVYVTTSKTLAWVYAWHAAGKGKPRVLEVLPIGRLEADPEHSAAMTAYRCEMAKVRSVDTDPTISEAEAREGWVTA